MKYVVTVLAIIAFLIIGIFSIQNLGPIEVSFLVWSITVSKIVVIVGTYLLGMLTGGGLIHLVKGYFQSA